MGTSLCLQHGRRTNSTDVSRRPIFRFSKTRYTNVADELFDILMRDFRAPSSTCCSTSFGARLAGRDVGPRCPRSRAIFQLFRSGTNELEAYQSESHENSPGAATPLYDTKNDLENLLCCRQDKSSDPANNKAPD